MWSPFSKKSQAINQLGLNLRKIKPDYMELGNYIIFFPYVRDLAQPRDTLTTMKYNSELIENVLNNEYNG